MRDSASSVLCQNVELESKLAHAEKQVEFRIEKSLSAAGHPEPLNSYKCPVHVRKSRVRVHHPTPNLRQVDLPHPLNSNL